MNRFDLRIQRLEVFDATYRFRSNLAFPVLSVMGVVDGCQNAQFTSICQSLTHVYEPEKVVEETDKNLVSCAQFPCRSQDAAIRSRIIKTVSILRTYLSVFSASSSDHNGTHTNTRMILNSRKCQDRFATLWIQPIG